MRLLPLYQEFRVRPSGHLLSSVKPRGSKTNRRPMQVNDLLRMVLMDEWCSGKWPAFLTQEQG